MKKVLCTVILFSLLCMSVSATIVDASDLDLTTECGYTASELDNVLKYELKGLGKYFIKAEKDYGVNAIFLCSVAALESGWGRYCFKENNMFGYGNLSFASRAECIDFVASKISKNYLSKEGKYYNGCTVKGVNKRYNGRQEWEDTVVQIMNSIYRKLK
jgi:beta-N-acetylglucosaminidase